MSKKQKYKQEKYDWSKVKHIKQDKKQQIQCQFCKEQKTGQDYINNIDNYFTSSNHDQNCCNIHRQCGIYEQIGEPEIADQKQSRKQNLRVRPLRNRDLKQANASNQEGEDVEDSNQNQFDPSQFPRYKPKYKKHKVKPAQTANKNFTRQIIDKLKLCLKELRKQFSIAQRYYTKSKNNGKKELNQLICCEELVQPINCIIDKGILRRKLEKSKTEIPEHREYNFEQLSRLEGQFMQRNYKYLKQN